LDLPHPVPFQAPRMARLLMPNALLGNLALLSLAKPCRALPSRALPSPAQPRGASRTGKRLPACRYEVALALHGCFHVTVLLVRQKKAHQPENWQG
ncbi:MAG: hypothetical protein ACMV1D_00445, partial [Macromonas sp.]